MVKGPSEGTYVVAFIDILGFRALMRSVEASRRRQVIDYLAELVERGESFGVGLRPYGPGTQVLIRTNVSTFSDNVVISVPVIDDPIAGVGIHMFIEQLFQTIISCYWRALTLGFLFRGAVTVGRLAHDGNIVAGEALVDAFELERKTEFPRVEVSQRLLEFTLPNGEALIGDSLRSVVIRTIDGRHFVRCLDFHVGVWWDYAYYRTGQAKLSAGMISQGIDETRTRVEQEVDRLRVMGADMAKARGKWEWVRDELSDSLASGAWAARLNEDRASALKGGGGCTRLPTLDT